MHQAGPNKSIDTLSLSVYISVMVYINIMLTVPLCDCVRDSTECPTRYRTGDFFNNSNTNEDIGTKFEQEYVPCVRSVR